MDHNSKYPKNPKVIKYINGCPTIIDKEENTAEISKTNVNKDTAQHEECSLIFYYFNAGGFRSPSRLALFRTLFDDLTIKPHVVVITETWFE